MIKFTKTIVFATALMLVFTAKAQGPGFFMGAESGAGLAALTGNSDPDTKARLGYSSGLFFGYDFKKILSLRTGAYFDVKGTAFQGTNYVRYGTYEVAGKFNFDYLTCPVLLRASFGHRRTRFFINTGPYISYLLKATQTIAGGSSDYTAFYKTANYGFIGGVGASHTWRQLIFSLEARSSLALTVQGYKNGYLAGSNSKVFAANLLLGIAYKIRSVINGDTSQKKGNNKGSWQVGVEAGTGVAGLRGNFIWSPHYLNRSSYQYGLSVQYDFKQVFSLCTGIYYDLKGARYFRELFDVPSQTSTFHNGEAAFNYLTIPLLIRMSAGNKLKVFMNAGPYFSFLLSAIDHDKANQSVVAHDINRTSDYAKTDAGLAGGVGVSYTIKRVVISIQVRDGLGLSAISNNTLVTGTNIRNNAANMLFGLAYKL